MDPTSVNKLPESAKLLADVVTSYVASASSTSAIIENVLQSPSANHLDKLVWCLQNDTELAKQVIRSWEQQYCSAVPTVVLESQIIDGVKVDFTDKAEVRDVCESSWFSAESASGSSVVAEAADGKHLVTFRALQGRNEGAGFSGISMNNNLYPGEVAEALAPLLLQQRKMYLDHKKPDTFGRATSEMAGIVNESWAKDGAAFVRTDVLTENPNTGWIFEVIQKYPTEVGVSIFSFVEGRKAKVDGRDVFVVTGWKQFGSLDFVGQPSAGGTFVALENKTPTPPVAVAEATIPLPDALAKHMRWSALDVVGYIVTDLLYAIAYDSKTGEEEKRAEIKRLVADLSTEIDKIDPATIASSRAYDYFVATESYYLVDLLKAQSKIPEANYTVMGTTTVAEAIEASAVSSIEFSAKTLTEVDKSQLPASSFLIVVDENDRSTWHLPVLDADGKILPGVLPAVEKLVRTTESFLIVPEESKTKLLQLLRSTGLSESISHKKEIGVVNLDELKALAIEQLLVAHPGVRELKESSDKARTDAQNTVQALQTEKVALEGTINDLKKKVDEFQLREAERERVLLVDRLLGESKVLDTKVEGHVSESFRTHLIKLAAEGEQVVQQAITDRETLITAERKRIAPPVSGNPQRQAEAPVAESNGSAKAFANFIEPTTPDALIANLRAK